jgi:S1-C subfamily serine protease
VRLSSLLYAVLACLVAAGPAAAADDPTASLVRIRAVAPDGALKVGSGVVTGPDRVATACHVTRHAATIDIVHGVQRWTARAQTGSVMHDVCVLSVAPARLELPVAELRDSSALQPGERVVAASFQGGRRLPTVSEGIVAALYPYDGGDVIRTTAMFDFGSSGGALFDAAGRVVGLLAFKASDANARFAVPSEWIAASRNAPVDFPLDPTKPQIAFWERTLLDRPAFLDPGLLGAGARDGR